MRTRTPQKTGVLGVPGVPESLKPSNGGTFSHGTPTHERQNTKPKEHPLCSIQTPRQRNTAPLIMQHQHRQNRNTTPHLFCPAGRSAFGRTYSTAAHAGAGLWVRVRGQGVAC